MLQQPFQAFSLTANTRPPHTRTHVYYGPRNSLSSLTVRDVPRFDDGHDSDTLRRQGRGQRVLNEFTHDESLSPGRFIFTAQSLNSTGLSIRPRSIWLGDSQLQTGQHKGQEGQLISPLGHEQHSQGE